MTAILGISAYYHDSAAALIVDGKIVAAVQEERFTRKKHDERFPRAAIDYCLDAADLTADQLDYVVFYDKPLLKFDRLLQTYLAYAPQGFWSFTKAIPQWLTKKIRLQHELRKGLKSKYRKRFLFLEHHESHAASAFFPSPFEEAAILTIDGVGEWATASYGIGRGNHLELHAQLRFPHSLGMLYSAFTYYCGFKVNSGEYKLMGLAPYGSPVYAKLILGKLIDIKEDGSFRLNMDYFNYCRGLTMTSPKFHRLFGGLPRKAESPLSNREMDLAASIQQVTEEILMRMARHLHSRSGMPALCLAGGVALNCVANGRLLREGPFDHLWIQPAAGDAGGALGAAFFVWHQLLNQSRTPNRIAPQGATDLGPEFSQAEINAWLDQQRATYELCRDEAELCERVATLLADGQVVGWVQGRMEFGPRALGFRSILGDPRDPEMQSRMNLKIKFRESFRPFAPSILQERVADYFEFDDAQSSPYMLLVTQVHAQHLLPVPETAQPGLDRLKQLRSRFPAITHVDNSARIQTVDAERNPLYHRLLVEFQRQTDCPMLINTSFNIRGEPIVCTPQDAWRCFLGTNMDALVLGRAVLLKSDQATDHFQPFDDYHSKFELD